MFDCILICVQIFEAEQANLYIEPIRGAAVMSSALTHSLAVLLHTSPLKGRHIVHQISDSVIIKAQTAIDIVSHSTNTIDGVMGGATYEREVFQYVYLSLDMMKQFLKATQMITKKSHHDCEEYCIKIENFFSHLIQSLKNVNITLKDDLIAEDSNTSSIHPTIVKLLNEILTIRIHCNVTCMVN